MMSSQNVLLHSKAIRLTVARLDIMRLARRAGPLLVTADLVVNLIAGALPVVFMIAAAVVVGRVPAAVRGGLHSSAWNALLIARTNVGLGDLPRVADDGAVLAALERARAAQVVSQFGQGLETPLGNSYSAGAELSGGQWQKLALGRALMRETALLLVLDEPTAAVDPVAEHELFEHYAAHARRIARLTDAITVLVSHRFSTVRMADLIAVLRDGHVKEFGDHDTLIKNGGLYAELCTLQAKAYS
jgi:ABC-type thiamine transport system ATPase subunit